MISNHKSARENISFLIVSVIVVFFFLSLLNSDSFGVELILAAGILLFLNFSKSNFIAIAPSMLTCGIAIVLLFMSGKMGERGFNAPITHAIKFVNLFFVSTTATVFRGFSVSNQRRIFKLVILSVLASLMISIYYAVFVDQYAIRYSAQRGFSQVIGFNQIYGLPFLITVVLFAILKSTDWKRSFKFFFVFLLCGIYCICISILATALLLTLFGMLLACAIYIYQKRRSVFSAIVILGILVIGIVYLFANEISDWIYGLVAHWPMELRDRIGSVVDKVLFTTHEENFYSYDRRNELASYSISSFLSNPLFGVGYSGFGYEAIGSHQEWQDMLGVFGIFGTICFYIVFGIICRRTYVSSKTQMDKTAFILALTIFMILGFFNPCLSVPVLFVLFVIAPNLSCIIPVVGNEIEGPQWLRSYTKPPAIRFKSIYIREKS